MDKNIRNDLIALALGWLVAVVFQYLVSDACAYFISQHWITDGVIANNSGHWLERVLTALRDKFFVSACFGLLFLVICLIIQGRIELEAAFFVTVIIGTFLSLWPYFTKTGQTDWDMPIFFMTCVPMIAVAWKLLYLWFPKDKVTNVDKVKDPRNDVKAVKIEVNDRAKTPTKVLVEQAKEQKKEDKPLEKPPVPPKEPPENPTQKSFWRID